MTTRPRWADVCRMVCASASVSAFMLVVVRIDRSRWKNEIGVGLLRPFLLPPNLAVYQATYGVIFFSKASETLQLKWVIYATVCATVRRIKTQ